MLGDDGGSFPWALWFDLQEHLFASSVVDGIARHLGALPIGPYK